MAANWTPPHQFRPRALGNSTPRTAARHAETGARAGKSKVQGEPHCRLIAPKGWERRRRLTTTTLGGAQHSKNGGKEREGEREERSHLHSTLRLLVAAAVMIADAPPALLGTDAGGNSEGPGVLPRERTNWSSVDRDDAEASDASEASEDLLSRVPGCDSFSVSREV